MNLRLAATTIAMCVASLSLALEAAAQTPGRITRESVDSLGGEALGESSAPSLSADGRFVAFQSEAADLVPQDTNQNTDVFVRDRMTGVVQRVSLAWNGMEARDDSGCPAISGDGRWVAFRSRAWNLYSGGANLGNPRWDVYVHDRQEGTTTHVTRSPEGADPDGDSGCPAISGDGSRIAFASAASNLVPTDDNERSDVFLYDRDEDQIALISKAADDGPSDGSSHEPAISQDGSVIVFVSDAFNLLPADPIAPLPWVYCGCDNVFAHDLATGVTELVSQSTQPQFTGNRESTRPSVSADGRFVAFESYASNLVVPNLAGKNVYVRDRMTDVTSVAAIQETSSGGCGPSGQQRCRFGTNHSPAISADGRFIAFSSGSERLLPANVRGRGSSIYLFDRIGGRLRRLSVDATGWAGEACSEEPAISADGKLVAYRSAATTLVPDDTNDADDVLSNEWTCRASGLCRTLASCPAEPLDCAVADASILRLRKRPPGVVKRDRLYWRWSGPESSGPFPDPTGAARYQICLYGKALSLDVAAPEAVPCTGTRPCWKTLASGYKLIDPQGGLTSLRITSVPGESRIVARGDGPLLDAPYLPLLAPQGIVVQLQETATGECWGTEFPTSSVKRNVAWVAKPGSLRSGHLAAEIP